MKKAVISFFLLINFLLPQPAWGQKSEEITQFHSEITINQNASVTIKETINYYTPTHHHGIYRYIPLHYQRDGFAYTTRIKDIQITDNFGKSIPCKQTKEKGSLNLRIGDPNNTFQGKKTYILTYTVENTLKRFEDYDELYWDIIGEGWQIPIKNSTAQISSPFAEIIKIDCFTGKVGTNDNLCQKILKSNQANFSYPQIIRYGDNFTVAVALNPENSIIFPSKLQQLTKTIKDNFFLFLIPFPLFIIFFLWLKKGRDWVFNSPNVFNLDENQPKHLKPLLTKHRTPMVYEPLKNLTPGEAGAILDEKVDNQDVIAEIIDLARKKYLKISALKAKKRDFKLEKLKEPGSELPKHQKYLMESIFGSQKEKTLSKLKGSFYSQMEKTKKMINESITKKGLFVQTPTKARLKYIGLFFLLNIPASLITIASLETVSSIWPMLFFGFQAIIGSILAFNMVQKTAKGTNLMLQAKGLKQTINLGKWREEIKEKHLFIEEIFPYAVALGVVKTLARDMEKLNLKPPSYLENYGLRYSSFPIFINSFSTKTASGLTHNPSSSKWSGGSGFSGGGSSGGGGGGGGGGSW